MFKTIISEEMFERPQEVIDLLKPYCYYYSSENMDELMKCLQYVTKQQKTKKNTNLVRTRLLRCTYDGKIAIYCFGLKDPRDLGYNTKNTLSRQEMILLNSDELQQGRMEYLCAKLGISLVQEHPLHHRDKEHAMH